MSLELKGEVRATHKFWCYHQRDSIQSREMERHHLALETAGEEMIQEKVLGHPSIYWFERGVEGNRKKQEKCDVMDAIREEFSGKRIVNGVKCCRKIKKREVSIDFGVRRMWKNLRWTVWARFEWSDEWINCWGREGSDSRKFFR